MTALTPAVVRPAPVSAVPPAGRSGSLAWMTLPALVVFTAFGLIPLLGVVLLSFTTWNGIGAIEPSGLDSWSVVLADPGLPHALWVTFLVMALSWLFQTPVSILIGTFLAGHHHYRAVLAVLYFVPLLLISSASPSPTARRDPNFASAPVGVPLCAGLARAAGACARRGSFRVSCRHPVPP